MPNIREIKGRIRSVRNTAKVTRAMEMIAASKMRRAQQRLLDSRPYSDSILKVMENLASQVDTADNPHPLMIKREVKNIQVVYVTPDRGLCGGLNANLNRFFYRFTNSQGSDVQVVSVGKKGRDFATRSHLHIGAEFIEIGDTPSVADITEIPKTVIDMYTNGDVDEVYLCYSQFISTTMQQPTITKILPVEPVDSDVTVISDYIYEPGATSVLQVLLPKFVEMQIFHAILESIGSEQSARMVAMSSATDSANEMIQDLTLLMNKVRQASITTELLDIVGGVAALEG
jgi:F-type H+-transporting ATPase subunit gamma